MDHREAVRGVFAVHRLLRSRRGGADRLFRRKVSLLAAAGSVLLRVTVEGLKDLEDTMGNSRPRILVLVLS